MKINGVHYETIWIDEENPQVVKVIDQQKLPFEFSVKELLTSEQASMAIQDMTVRGAPLIGVTGAMGIYLAALHAGLDNWKEDIRNAAKDLASARPTAVNLQWAIDRVMEKAALAASKLEAIEKCLNGALEILDEERENCRLIGEHGVKLIVDLYKKHKRTIHVLTHCNAGWLACIDYGTATAPVYMAHDLGVPVHVWVDETRPRNQGARLTAYELGQHGVPHTVIADNAGGHLMQHGKVDLVLVGSDRTTASGDVANKIGTYLKALAAKDNGVPFYVALPTSSIDYSLNDGLKEIPIEERNQEEVSHMEGTEEGSTEITKIKIIPDDSECANPAFDVTPANLVKAYISERGLSEDVRSFLL